MFGRIALFAVFFLVSTAAFAQTTIPAVQVTGVRINETRYDVCGTLSCNSFYNPPVVAPVSGQFAEVEDVEAEEPAACHNDAERRETVVWEAYKAMLIAAHRGNVLAAIAADDRAGDFILTVLFSDGSFGQYQRADSEFRSSQGFLEIKAPDCKD